ncbi:sel1 repeat family protein [Roseospirillum parvum]|uniref:Sel1 repeat family protein n=1 Tax=Roseospirillum parvum TaxID=83401 RepID=A0A1G8DIT7_9PROT|nr:sel1 repeat family protein [Roseospirillum parvum]SDH57545.1 hypothetical protein SAMN05421742_10830 [Roseospirillum parvum]
MRLWVFLLAMVMTLPVVAEEVTCGPDGPWHDPAMDYHLDDLLALIEARLDWEEGKPREDDPGDPERVAAAVAAWQRLAEPHEGRPGNAEARWWLGHLMMEGKAGFEADAWGALEFLLPAAEAGHLEAMTQTGRILVREANAEKLTPDSAAIPAPTKGRACLKRAAWLGNREAQTRWAVQHSGSEQERLTKNLAGGLDLLPEALTELSNAQKFEADQATLGDNLLRHCAICGSELCQVAITYRLGSRPRTVDVVNEGVYWIAVLAYYHNNQSAKNLLEEFSQDIIEDGESSILDSARSFKKRDCY